MITDHKIYLNAAEIAALWSNYMNDSVGVCTIASYIKYIEDREIHSVLEFALNLSISHLEKLKSFFNEERYPIPDGFQQEHDASKDAPRLFTDDFCLFYIQNMGKIGMEFYTTALSNAARLDMCEYFTECLNESSRLLNKATEIMLMKGTFIRAPFIPIPQKNEYVQKQSYMAGFFGHHRPLNVIEISNIYYNLIRNQLGRTLLIGFSQVASSQKVREYMVRGRDIADKHVEIFGSLLSKEFLPSASSWDTMPTTSTTTTFSDKLMMFQATSLNADGIAHYGRSLALSPRRDLASNYVRLTSEILNFAEDGANIMIDNGWLEQPPQASDRDLLASEQ
ncbi:hypothetical protein ASG89_31260 [Paenibacillus sp. Soil766]|uniref:DUF3231 family protein n=1 Tax=Paenibacillus sp. Soil766 TaxID=1736404 RepID=UPI00070BF82A|nr:DUF3231 family protein [Paenibacillus sp. Soil766]KRE96448.1 hypothetical protein ASG89_31260 [Paenibacillus sp. Soil766]